MNQLSRWSPQLLGLLRIMTGLLILEHGLQKLVHFPPPANVRPFQLMSLAGVAAILEFGGGILLTLGFFTRVTAFILSGEMAFVYFIAHAPRGFYPILNGGEIAIVYCFLLLFMASAGPGAWALDNRLRRTPLPQTA